MFPEKNTDMGYARGMDLLQDSMDAKHGTALGEHNREGHIIQIEEARNTQKKDHTGEETQEKQDRNHTDKQMDKCS